MQKSAFTKYTDPVYEIYTTENLESLLARGVWAKIQILNIKSFKKYHLINSHIVTNNHM